MAEDNRTPDGDDLDTATPTAGTDPGDSRDEQEQPAPARRKHRRAGAPVGAPPAVDTAADQSSEPRTIVAEQRADVEDEPAPTRPARRRRAGAPAGPPELPVFSAAVEAQATAVAEDEEEAEQSDDGAAEEPQAPDTGRDGPHGIADDLAALADGQSRSDAEDTEAAARMERAQLDLTNLLFQAPEPQTTVGSASVGTDSEDDEDAAGEDSEDTSGSERRSGSGRSRRRSRSNRSQSGPDGDRSADRASDDDSRSDEGADASDDDSDEADDSQDSSRSGGRRRRRRGGRGRRGRGRGDADDAQSDDEAEDSDGAESSDDQSSGDDDSEDRPSRSRRSRRGRSKGSAAKDGAQGGDEGSDESDDASEDSDDDSGTSSGTSRRRRRRRRSGTSSDDSPSPDDPPNTVVKVRERRDEVKAVKGSTRLEAKKQRRREGRDAGRRRSVITEAEFLARRESVKRSMVVRERPGRTQIAVLEDGVLVEHYVAQKAQSSMVGNVYLGKVQNVLPSMEAAFVDIGKGRNAVLYAGEVNWDAAGLDGQPRRIELALKSGDPVLVQVTKDPIGHKGARLTSQISLPGRYVVYVPGGSMTGISRKLPDAERSRLKKIMKQVIPDEAGVIVRTAAEGASEEELTRDVERLRSQWARIEKLQKSKSAPASLSQEPDLAIRVVRDVFNEDFNSLIVEGSKTYDEIHEYVSSVAPDLLERVTKHVGEKDVFAKQRIDEQLLKAMDRKVYLPSGGSLVIDRTEAMTVIDVNTGKFTGSGGSLEETVTRNNLEAAEEIVRQLRLRDIGGIIVIDFIDMVLEANRDLVLRRLVECLSRDRTKHQVAEVTSLGLVQMTRKRVGQGLVETFSTTCEACNGRGVSIDIDGNHHHESDKDDRQGSSRSSRRRSKNGGGNGSGSAKQSGPSKDEQAHAGDESQENVHRLEEDTSSRELARATIASIAAATTSSGSPEVVVDGQVVEVDGSDHEQDQHQDRPQDQSSEGDSESHVTEARVQDAQA